MLLLALLSAPAFAQSVGSARDAPPPMPAGARVPVLEHVGIDQHLNRDVPLDLPFVDERGRAIRLGDFFGARPVVLVLAYYDCPMLCTFVLNGSISALQQLPFDAGKDFEFVTVSIDPSETATLAAAKKAAYLGHYTGHSGTTGFHFLTGPESSISQLTEAVGFRYAYVAETKQFAHPALVTVLTPSGRISRYLYGIDFPPADLRMALVEAGSGRIGTPVDRALLYCYHYDAANGRYGVAVTRLLRIAGFATLAGLGTVVGLTVRARRRRIGRELRR
jgi:protein SCO1